MGKKCPKCNSTIKETVKFCENCSYKLNVKVKKDFDIFTDDISPLSKRQLKKKKKLKKQEKQILDL